MYCKKCGARYNDDDAFCMKCGERLSLFAPKTENLDFNDLGVRVSRRNPVWALAHDTFKSYLFIIALFSLTISLILTCIEQSASFDQIYTFLRGLIRDVESKIEYLPSSYMTETEVVLDIAKDVLRFFKDRFILIMIPDILIVLGLWITFGLMIIPNRAKTKSFGLSFVKAGIAIKELCIWFSFVVAEIYILLIVSKINRIASYFTDVLNTNRPKLIDKVLWIIAICAIALLFVTVLCSLFFSGLRRSARTVLYTIDTGSPSYEVSQYSGTVCIIIGCIVILNAFFRSDETAILISVFGGIASFAIGWILCTYRSKMTDAIILQRELSK